MFLALWNYIRGYVIIYVTGFSVERFINLAVNRGIFIWDVVPEGKCVVMKAAAASAEALRECSIKTGCKFEITGEYGLPVFLKGCAARKAFVGGVIAFAVAMYIMSSFIWTVRVVGCERLDPEKITESCAGYGIAPGRLKYGTDLYEAGKKLMTEYSDISWIAVNLKGTGITVHIVETIPKTQYVQREEPMDVIANTDGIITGIAVASGTAVVKEGDEVKKGDVLISNVVPLKDGETQTGEKYVCASGEVYAEKKYDLEGIAPLNYNERVFTGKTKKDYSIDVGGESFNIVSPSLEKNYEVMSDDRLTLDIGDYRLPFAINRTVYGQTEAVKMKRTEDEAAALAQKQLSDKIAALTAETGGELSSLSTRYVMDGTSVRVEGEVSVILRIDEQKKADSAQNEEVTE